MKQKPRLFECYACGEMLEASAFYPSSRQCKSCLIEKRKLRIAADSEKYSKQNAANCAKYRAKLAKRNGSRNMKPTESRLKREIAESRRKFEKAEQYKIMTSGDSESTAHTADTGHRDLTPDNTSVLLPKKTKQVLPAEISEQKAGEKDPVFDAFRKLKRPNRERWLDIK